MDLVVSALNEYRATYVHLAAKAAAVAAELEDEQQQQQQQEWLSARVEAFDSQLQTVSKRLSSLCSSFLQRRWGGWDAAGTTSEGGEKQHEKMLTAKAKDIGVLLEMSLKWTGRCGWVYMVHAYAEYISPPHPPTDTLTH